jgi:hypothetical protein
MERGFFLMEREDVQSNVPSSLFFSLFAVEGITGILGMHWTAKG